MMMQLLRPFHKIESSANDNYFLSSNPNKNVILWLYCRTRITVAPKGRILKAQRSAFGISHLWEDPGKPVCIRLSPSPNFQNQLSSTTRRYTIVLQIASLLSPMTDTRSESVELQKQPSSIRTFGPSQPPWNRYLNQRHCRSSQVLKQVTQQPRKVFP
ncbi:hypothetical protein BDR07DRAFT_1398099 [Suillus spraguei]|nr:hypothetical protein BDR07DRAFT_1398099 [Suillus spraguei]